MFNQDKFVRIAPPTDRLTEQGISRRSVNYLARARAHNKHSQSAPGANNMSPSVTH